MIATVSAWSVEALSVTLMDALALEATKGIKINGVNITNIGYADDTVLLAESEDELQGMINKLCDTCANYGISLNAKKIKVMLIRKGNEDHAAVNIKVEGTRLEEVEYKYLGQWITADGRCLEEVKRRIVSYGSESWTYGKRVIRKIRAFENWCCWRILRIGWKDHVTNEMVEQWMGCQIKLAAMLCQRKARFAGHIIRGSSTGLASLVIEGTIEGIRGRGIPRRTWGKDITTWTKTENLGSAKRTAENRSLWRSLAVNLRIEEDIG
ncbi:uncharacterized protein [Penaeus vannamei]|uniref:uncharacterized protein n=1 Tax=Penaeus vannamei TaxID=6689 RepID=UPI00387F4981